MTIRPTDTEDALAIASLNGQLGYPTPVNAMRERLTKILRMPDTCLFVAECDGVVRGWLQISGVHFLASTSSFAEISGLVIDVNVRRQGIGSALVLQAEAWAIGRGYREVRLRSGLHRVEAHHFYQAIGYELAKTSYMFCKALSNGQ